MPESHLSCQGVKATPSGQWQVEWIKDLETQKRGWDPVLWPSEEAATKRMHEFMDAGCQSAGAHPLYRHPDGRTVRFSELPPGYWLLDVREDRVTADAGFMCILPEGSETYLPLARGNPAGPRVWGWDGNMDVPTIAPSIWYQGRWHGFFQQGYFRSC